MTDTVPGNGQAPVNGPGQDAPRTEQGQERPPRNSERGGRGGRNERRPDRNRRPDENIGNDASSENFSHSNTDTVATPVDRAARTPHNEASSTGHGDGTGESATLAEGTATREKRSRDRYGRDRAPRGERTEQGDRQEQPVRDSQTLSEDTAAEPRKSYFTASTEAPTTSAAPVAVIAPVSTVSETPPATPVTLTPATPEPVPTPVIAPAAVASAPVATATGMPKLQPFVLPLSELAQVAQSSGLSWVNSDAEKIAAVQAAIAAEPKAVHVQRERPAAVPIDEEPLMLVETKRDLRNITLPFEEKGPQ